MKGIAMPRFTVRKNKTPHQTPYLLLDRDQKVEPVFRFLNLQESRNCSACTLRAYTYDLLDFYRFLDAHQLNIDKISQHDFVDFILAHRRRNAAPRTINRRLVVIRCFLNDQFSGLGDSLLKKYSAAFYKGRRNKALLGPSRIKSLAPQSLRVKVPT